VPAGNETAKCRVPTLPGKSWNCICKISTTWKVPENEFGCGKSWKSKCKFLESPGIVFVKFPVHGKSWKMTGPGMSGKSKCKVLKSPGIVFVKFPGPG